MSWFEMKRPTVYILENNVKMWDGEPTFSQLKSCGWKVPILKCAFLHPLLLGKMHFIYQNEKKRKVVLNFRTMKITCRHVQTSK